MNRDFSKEASRLSAQRIFSERLTFRLSGYIPVFDTCEMKKAA